MSGDCLFSFAKRRLGLKSSEMAIGLDQIPEALLPAISIRVYPAHPVDISPIDLLFCVGALLLSRVLFRFGLRERPY
jgi:hypothetical protein